MILRFHWCWIPCENTFGWDGCWGFPRCLHVPLYRGVLAVDKKFWIFLKQVDTLMNLSVNWNCLGVVWICGRLVCDMPWCSVICLAYILLVFPAWCPPFSRTRAWIPSEPWDTNPGSYPWERIGRKRMETFMYSHTHYFRDSQGNFKFVCLSMNWRTTVLCGARHAVHGQNQQVDWNSVLRGTAGGHHHVSCIWLSWWTPLRIADLQRAVRRRLRKLA